MAIIHLGTLADKGKPDFYVQVKAGRELYHYENDGKRVVDGELQGPFVDYTTYTSHHGLCLRDYEINGYDDSDFCMVVWNEERQEPETITFASTRGWSYPCYGSFVDATDEVKAKYAEYEKARYARAVARERHLKAVSLKEIRDFAKAAGVAYDFPAYRLTSLRNKLTSREYSAICQLVKPKSKIRNAFKLSLRERVVTWLKTEKPSYPTPLSAKQLRYL